MNEQTEMTSEQITPEMQQQMDEIKQILDTPIIDTTMALNIIINAVQVCYDNADIFNELDKALIAKALGSFQEQVKNGEDFTIKVSQ
jgi:heme oxygenase